ncbi:MAG: topoisomerase [Candidatus Dependentiae bacterium]|nr:topoisomerase [Candidatus Dependentiae bacterium]
MPKLLIVESPAKIKTIGKFLGKEFKIMSTFGHVKDLPPHKLGVTITADNQIDLEYVPLDDKADTISQICKQARTCDEVFLASDPDREGEIISWHIGQEIEKVLKKGLIHRITFNEITKPAVEKAIADKRSIDENKVHAQQARRVLDRWVGYEVSPILWKKITKGLSAGRVQSVGLMLVCLREDEIVAFKVEEYWSIHGIFVIDGETFEAELARIKGKKPDVTTKEGADAIIAKLKGAPYTISKVTDKKRLKQPAPPFMTSSLQQDAFNKLGFSVDRTMQIAQKLYEGLPLRDKDNPEALITYMRTDSLRISETAMVDVRDYIKNTFGSKYLPTKERQFEAKGASQDAHEAIRPIDVSHTPDKVGPYLSAEQAKLYELIWKRFVASQMEAAEFFQRTVQIEGGDYEFRTTGSTLMFDGFLNVYLAEEDEEEKSATIPKSVADGKAVDLNKGEGKQHFTKPPARYTQATLVKELKEKDIGRPSTYAAILSTLIKRNYVTVDNKRFSPSELGRSVNKLLTHHLPDIINVDFTANMEQSLDKIAEGSIERDKVLLEFYKKFSKDLEAFGGAPGKKEAQKTELTCPESGCGKALYIRFGRSGEFVGCEGFPDCTFTSNYTRDEQGNIMLTANEPVQPETTGLKCPKCSKDMVKRIGKYGPFISCSGYPACKHIHQETLKMACPKCGGQIAKRAWRGGSFWGCTGYPNCKFAVFNDVKEIPCSKCGTQPYMIVNKGKDGVETLSCPDKECGNVVKE